MKFLTGDTLDSDHCTVLTHEFFRCDDSFKEFAKYAEQMIIQGQTREISYRTYNAYTNFIHHLYEFLLGCLVRDTGNTNVTNRRKGYDPIPIIEGYITHHAQRILNRYCDEINNGTAPSWVNHISCYDITVPPDFAKEFREYRNKAIGHVAYERASKLSLSEFYHTYHKFLYLLYSDSIYYWGKRSEWFPDLKEITDFSVMISNERD